MPTNKKNPCSNTRPPPPASKPWEKITTDLFKFQKNDYVIVVDYYSNYPEIAKLCSTVSYHVIEKLKSTTETVMSDNVPQYASREFKEFAKEWEFKHITYPNSNGMTERAVQTIKQLLKRAIKSGEDPY